MKKSEDNRLGNSSWKLRSRHGREKLFKTPELLLEAAQEYFQWCDHNPWISIKEGTTPKGGTSEKKYSQRPYTLSGLCHYLNCSESYFRKFEDNNQDSDDFITVIEDIKTIIETQQFEGAIVGAFNANIISRKLGLSDKKDIRTNDNEFKLTFNRVPD